LVPEKQQRQAVASLLHWLASCYQLDEATLTETAGQLSSLSDGQLRDLLAAATAANEVCLDSVPPSIPTSSCCIPLPINLKPRLLVCRLRRWTDLDDNSEELLRVCRCSVENGNANGNSSSEPATESTSVGAGFDVFCCANPMHYTRRVWCTAFYYELNNRVGDAFKASEPCLRIDGGGGGSFDRVGRRRFCLAPLWNADRPAAAHAVRRCIGQGLLLQLCRGGTVYLQCRSPVPVFVQSPNASLQRGWHPATVCRVPPGGSLCVFSDQLFLQHLSDCRRFEDAYSLIRMCSIRISFAKGWGSDYRRQRITATPCWLEIVLARPLVWLDRVLVAMGGPN
ncbi:hypothetical protein BOX15_Mlig013894g2, partial [Macrostomum lignano]